MKKNYRLGKDVTAVYNSLADAATALGVSKKENTSSEKLEQKKEKFLKKHKCRACGQPLTYMGGNVMTCTNPKCKGIKVENTDAEGNKHVSYITSYELLDNVGTAIAEKIYS